MRRPRKIEVYVVIEGGTKGSQGDAQFRRGYRTFLEKIVPREIGGRPVALEPVRGLGRTNAHSKFASQRILHPDALILLLIDTDAPFDNSNNIWNFLEARDHITKPLWAEESHVYLMVQCVETWLVADGVSLQQHYDSEFKSSSLPKRRDLESIAHHDVQKQLEKATAKCSKPYEHVDSSSLIAFVCPENIDHLPNAHRLKTGLVQTVTQFALNNL